MYQLCHRLMSPTVEYFNEYLHRMQRMDEEVHEASLRWGPSWLHTAGACTEHFREVWEHSGRLSVAAAAKKLLGRLSQCHRKMVF